MKKIRIILVILTMVIASTIIYLFSRPSLLVGTWVRTTEVDTEHINFYKNHNFSYYYGVGSPVGDYDLCSKYAYNEKEKLIKLECYEGVLDEIKVESVSSKQLIIIIDQEKLVFERK